MGHVTTFGYTNGCLTSITDALSHTTTIACNPIGQPIGITNALGDTTTFSYLGFDLRSITDPLGRTITFSTDALGRLVAVRDPAGNLWQRTYDVNDRVVSTTDPSSNQTTMTYDGDGHLTSVTLPNGGTIRYAYNARGWRTSRTDALGQSSSWTYNAMGDVLSHTDRKGQTTTVNWDLLGRPTQVTFADGSTQQYSFDAGNRLTQIADSADGTLSNAFNGLNELTQQSSPAGTVSYAYDAANRLTSITQGSETVGFSYDAANRRIELTLPNGVTTTYGYDAASDLTGLNYADANGSVLGNIAYTYNTAGQRSGESGSLASDVLPPATTAPATVDLNDRLTSWNGQTYSYDADGNLTGNGTDTYVWNARNQLTAIKQGGTTIASFSYDPLGRRVGTDFNGNAASYLYDGLNAVQETHGSTATSILTGLAVDERFARTDLGGRTDFLSDALNSTIALTNSAGAIVEQYSYDPYGNTTASASGFDNPYQYTGRENDGDGLYYYRARYYAPAMGRFISEDPIGFAGGENFYGYAVQNPLIYRDPKGFDPELIGELIAGGGFTAAGAFEGYMLGRLNGDTGSALGIDTAIGAGNGFLFWATDDVPSAWGMGIRAAASGGLEAGGEYAKGQCINGEEVLVASVLSLLGDANAKSAEWALDQGEMNSAAHGFSMYYGMTMGNVMQGFGDELTTGATPQDGLLPYMPQGN